MTRSVHTALLASAGVFALSLPVLAEHLDPQVGISLSTGSGEQVPDLHTAAKPKINRLANGWLVTVWADGAGGSTDNVYDVKGDYERPARDLFVRTCNSKSSDCLDIENWSDAVNISNTAHLSSRDAAWRGEDEPVSSYAGDSDKPNIFKSGSTLAVSWVDKYCPGGEQGSVTYLERDNREIPFSCTYVARSLDSGATWGAAQQLSSGYRDAKQDVNRGNDKAWAVTWQEDPAGLQLGGGEGPGDGASGANVNNGTDIWYTALPYKDFSASAPFPEATRLTDNFTRVGQHKGASTGVEDGDAGASRANLAMLGSTVQVAYEETKASGGADYGKLIRYHVFNYAKAPTSCAPDPLNIDECELTENGHTLPAQDDPERMGCILSDPGENARRVRFFSQGTAGTNSGVKMFIFWKQGLHDEGGPSDIIGRRGVAPMDDEDSMAGLRWQDMEPPIAAPTAAALGDVPDGCLIYGDEDEVTGAFANEAGWNLSASTEAGGDLTAATDDDDYEDARAHRGIMKGDFIALGWSYTPDWAVATYTDEENYDFWLRSSTDGGATWSSPTDISGETTLALAEERGLAPTGIHVKEPRIVKTPGDGPDCPSGDPESEDTTDPTDCSNGNVFLVAFGTETNIYEETDTSDDLDLYVLRSTDKGATFESVAVLAEAEADEGESQLQLTPNGDHVYATWFAHYGHGTEAMFTTAEADEEHDDTGVDTADDTADDTSSTVEPDTDTPADDTDAEEEGKETQCSCSASTGPQSWLALLALLAPLLARRRQRRD